jgi:DNA repair protein RadA/Sms
MAKKAKTGFFCQNCGAQHNQWMGQCSRCNEWNTIVEELISTTSKQSPWKNAPTEGKPKTSKAHLIHTLRADETIRFSSSDHELDRVLGGGLVPGSVTLMGGEPGIGKSTLMLQVALKLKTKCLYISGEESEQQVKLRAERIGIENTSCYLFTATQTQEIFQQIVLTEPDLIVIDSIQTLHSDILDSAPGSVSQIRQCASEFIQYAKESGIPLVLIGHITKDGNLAGPKILEHMVDTVLQFEGDRNHVYRILRALKNRFGSTAEIGIYEMQGMGLREVANPSEVLISKRDNDLSGNAIASTLEGIRPMLIEIQALASTAVYGTPQRSTTGFDTRRLNMLLAVLEKRCGFRLGSKDVFLNVTGGIRVDDPAIDLAVMAAILSSSEDIPVPAKVCFSAEIGLSGEIRPVARVEQRILEAQKMGLDQIFVSSHNKIDTGKYAIEVVACGKIEEVFNRLFG